jgi:PilZ domain
LSQRVDDFRTLNREIFTFWGVPFVTGCGYDSDMNPANPALSLPSEPSVELRAAVRFPLRIPISISTEWGEKHAMTENISAIGILFELAEPLPVASSVSFTIKMPAEAMGTPTDVVVHSTGRVVRSTLGESGWHVAAVIDKYYFSH